MKTLQSRTLAVVVILVLARVAASAAIETQVIDYGSASSPLTGGTVNLSYNEFNPALGRLDGITIILSSYDTAEAEVFSTHGAGIAYDDAMVSNGSETVSALGLTTSAKQLSAGSFSGTTTGFLTVAGSGHTQHDTAVEHISAADASSFIGVGSEEFVLSIVPGTGRFSGEGPSSLGFGGVFNSYGSIEIQYTYAPVVAAPETSNFSYFTGAFAALAALGGLVRQVSRSEA